jgi:hypothetical protein
MLAARPVLKNRRGRQSNLADRRSHYAKAVNHDVEFKNPFVLAKSVFAPRQKEWG